MLCILLVTNDDVAYNGIGPGKFPPVMTSLQNHNCNSRKRKHLVWDEDMEGEGEGEDDTPTLPALPKVARVARATKRPMALPSTAIGPNDLERVLEEHSCKRSVKGTGNEEGDTVVSVLTQRRVEQNVHNCHMIYTRHLDDRVRISCKECKDIDLLVEGVLAQEFGKERSAISTVTSRFGKGKRANILASCRQTE